MITSEFDFLTFAYKLYENPRNISIKEFEADIKRFTHLNALLTRYRVDRFDLKDRLISNHIVILANCFGVDGMLKMFTWKISDDNWCILNTFLCYMGLSNRVPVDLYLQDILETA